MHASHPLMGPSHTLAERGFTIIELMVVVAILAILAALAAPSFQPLVERWRTRDAAEALTSTIYYARSEAIKRGGRVAIDATGGWSNGWSVTYTQSGTTTDLQKNAALTKITADSGDTKLFIDRWGMLSSTDGGIPTAVDIALYPAGKANTDPSAIRLCVGLGGRIEQKKQGAAC